MALLELSDAIYARSLLRCVLLHTKIIQAKKSVGVCICFSANEAVYNVIQSWYELNACEHIASTNTTGIR